MYVSVSQVSCTYLSLLNLHTYSMDMQCIQTDVWMHVRMHVFMYAYVGMRVSV